MDDLSGPNSTGSRAVLPNTWQRVMVQLRKWINEQVSAWNKSYPQILHHFSISISLKLFFFLSWWADWVIVHPMPVPFVWEEFYFSTTGEDMCHAVVSEMLTGWSISLLVGSYEKLVVSFSSVLFAGKIPDGGCSINLGLGMGASSGSTKDFGVSKK
jgi:hypothetical protein